jgi:glycosyltransferase involved in cell wall biosynthesis
MRVAVVSNDLVPEMGTPVAAPGLRASGLAAGLRAHGHEVTVAVDAAVAERYGDGVGPAADVEVIGMDGLMGFLEERTPVAALLINANQADHVFESPGVRFVYDLFAPRLLEVGHRGDGDQAATLDRIRSRKVKALGLASAVTLNGRRKAGYAAAWLERAGRDPGTVPTAVVPMPVEPLESKPHPEPRLVLGGYLQHWSRPGAWLDRVAGAADGVPIEIVTGRHWGTAREPDPGPYLGALIESGRVVRHDPMPYDEFRRVIAGAWAFVDLFDDTLERRLAMVTRSVVALATSVPVIHPPFTEVGSLVDGAAAGWVVDPSDPEAVAAAVSSATTDAEDVAQRSAAALGLAREVFEPKAATAPLSALLREWS